MGSLSNYDDDDDENVTYSILFNSSNVGKCFWRWILKDRTKVQEKKKKIDILCSRPRQNVKLGSFTL